MKADLIKVKKEVVTYVEEDQINLSLSREEFELILLSIGAISVHGIMNQYKSYFGLNLEKMNLKEIGLIQDEIYSKLRNLHVDLTK